MFTQLRRSHPLLLFTAVRSTQGVFWPLVFWHPESKSRFSKMDTPTINDCDKILQNGLFTNETTCLRIYCLHPRSCLSGTSFPSFINPEKTWLWQFLTLMIVRDKYRHIYPQLLPPLSLCLFPFHKPDYRNILSFMNTKLLHLAHSTEGFKIRR